MVVRLAVSTFNVIKHFHRFHFLTLGKTNSKAKGKPKRSRNCKLFDDEAVAADDEGSDDEDSKGEKVDLDNYALKEPGNSQDSDWSGPRVTSSLDKDIVYQDESGKGVTHNQLASTTSKNLLRKIRDWKLSCTSDAIAVGSQRQDLIIALKKIQGDMEELESLDVSFKRDAAQTKLREGRIICHISLS